MATILLEGFDEFGPAQGYTGVSATQPGLEALLGEAGWVIESFGNFASYANIQPGLSGAPGYSLCVGATTYVVSGVGKTLSSSYGRIIGGVRVCPNIGRDNGILFYDGTTAQCSIIIQNTTGLVVICEGSDGTVLESSTFTIGNGSVHYIEWDITFNNNGYGGWTVWVDGAPILNGTGTTQQSSNSSMNTIILASFSNDLGHLGAGYCFFDDLYLFDDTTDYNNQALLSSPVVVTQGPAEDYQTQWNNQASIVGNYYPQLTPNSASVIQANRLYVCSFTPVASQTITAVGVTAISAASGAHVMPLLFSDLSGVPNALLSSGPAVTGIVNGTTTLDLTTDVSLVAGTQYWIGFMTDTAVNIQQFASGVNQGIICTYTYASGAPSTCPSGTAGQASLVIFGYCAYASTDFQSLNLNPPQGDLSYTSTGLTGPADVFFFPPLPLGVTNVYTVGLACNAALQSSSSLIFSLAIIPPNGTSGFGSAYDFEPTTSYEWYETFLDAEPGTDGVWNVNDVDRAIVGMLTNS